MRFVLATVGSHGDVTPYLAVARALAARGHRVVVATHAHYRPLVEDAGAALHALRPDYDVAWGPRVMDRRRGAEALLRDVVAAHVREGYDDLRAAVVGADLLLSHPLTLAAPLVAATTDVAWASAVLAPMSLFSLADDMPLLAPALAPVRRHAPALYRAILRGGQRIARRWVAPVDALRRDLGLPPGAHPVFAGQHAPALVLALFSPLLAAPQPDWPRQTLVTGAVVDDAVHGAAFGGAACGGVGAARDGPVADALPPPLARFLAAGAPPLVFTLGTSAVLAAGARRVYAESVRAARALGRRAVLLTGADPANVPAGLGDDLLAVPAASHAALFPHAATVVHQGGMGTLTQALRAGRPMLVVPFAHDQPDNADRAARLGVARVVPPGRYRAARVAAALRALLDDPAVAARAAAVGAEVRREDGAAAAAVALERLAVERRAAGG